jgi:tetratricopeptide (TPR) repeat protein
MIDIIDENLFCPLNVSQINKDHTLLGPPRSGKSTFAHYNNLELNEEEIGFVDIKKEKHSTEKILNKIKNAITSPLDKVFGKLIKVEEFKKQFSGIILEEDMRKLLGNPSQGKISSKITYHIDTLLKNNKPPILYWLNLEEIQLKGYSSEEFQKYAKVNWLGIDFYPPKLLKYDIEKLKEAQNNYEKFCHKMGIPVSGEDFYKMQKPTFFIGFVPPYAGNVLSRLTGLLGNLHLPGIIPQVISTSVVPLISGVIVMGIMTLMVKKENIDVKADIIEIVNGWGKLDEEFKHVVAAKIAFETDFTEEEVFDAYERLSGISEDELLSKILDQIKPELDELRKEIESLKEQLYSKGTEKIVDINKLRDKLNIQDRDENLIGLGNSENDRKVREQIDRIINNSQDHICIIKGEAGSGKTTLLYMIGRSLLDKGSRVYYIEESGPFSFLDFPKFDAYALYDVKDPEIAEILRKKLNEAILNKVSLAKVIISVRTSYLKDSNFDDLRSKEGFKSVYEAQMGYNEQILQEMAIRSLKDSFPNLNQDYLGKASKILAMKSEDLPLYIKEAVKMLEKKGFSLELLNNLPSGTTNMILSILSEEEKRDSSLTFVYFLVANYPRFPQRLLKYVENFFDINSRPNYMDENSDGKLSLHSWYRDALYSLMDARNPSDIINKLDISEDSRPLVYKLLGSVKKIIQKRNIFNKIKDTYERPFEDFINKYPNNPILSELKNSIKEFFNHPNSIKPLDLSDVILLSSIIGYVDSEIRRDDNNHYGFNTLEEKVDYPFIEPSCLGAYNELIGFLVNNVAIESSRISEGEIRPFYLFLLIAFMNLFHDEAVNTLEKEFLNMGAQSEMNYDEIHISSMNSSLVIQRYIKAFFLALGSMGFLNSNQDNSSEQVFRMAFLIYELKLDFEEAIKEIDRAIELNPNDPACHINKGIALGELGRYEEAIKEIDRAIELNPNDPACHNNKGNALGELGRHEEAIEEYNKAIELNPDNPNYHNNIGNALGELGRYKEAIKEIDRAIELNPNDPACHNNKGNALGELGRYKEAIEEYNKAIELNPDNPNYHYNKGIALGALGRYKEAIEEYNKAIELNPNDPAYHYNKGIALRKLGRYEEAIEEYNKAIELNPNDPAYHSNKGIALGELGRYKEAIEEYNKAIELNPKNPVYHMN